jgi:integrase
MSKVTLRNKKLAGGRLSLYLDFYPPIIDTQTGKETRREFLKFFIYENPKSPDEKKHNTETNGLAELVAAKRLVQIRNKEFGFKENINLNINFVAFFNTVVEDYYNKGSNSNYLCWKASYNHFTFLFGDKLMSHQVSANHVKKFRTYLLDAKFTRGKSEKKLSVNTASSYFKNFIAVLKLAYKENLLAVNLAEGTEYIKEQETHRQYLTEEELVILWNTEIKNEKVKYMALFSALTGLRFVDVNNLKWDDIFNDNHQNYYILLREQKTKSIHNHPISKMAYDILKTQNTTPDDTIFGNIKYHEITRPMKDWIEKSGIKKKISYHNFRHSYATLQLANGTDIYTVSKLLGHKNLSTTQIYTKVLDKNKIEAANRINLKLDGLS